MEVQLGEWGDVVLPFVGIGRVDDATTLASYFTLDDIASKQLSIYQMKRRMDTKQRTKAAFSNITKSAKKLSPGKVCPVSSEEGLWFLLLDSASVLIYGVLASKATYPEQLASQLLDNLVLGVKSLDFNEVLTCRENALTQKLLRRIKSAVKQGACTLDEAREERRALQSRFIQKQREKELLKSQVRADIVNIRGANVTSKASAAQVSGEGTQRQIDAFMALVERQWTGKRQNLLHELRTNLRQPSEQSGATMGAEPVGLPLLAEVCEQLREVHGQKPLNASLQERLLAVCGWVVYTMQDVDIDRLFHFQDCPLLPNGMEEPAQRDDFYKEYRSRWASSRNPQMFSAANWAARECFDRCGDASSKPGKDSIKGLGTWIKWLCFLCASAQDLEEPVTVTRGLCGLPDFLINQLSGKSAGDILFWAAPSSTTDDASVSESYCNQQMPKERNVIFTISGVRQSFPMFQLSQYPKEREWLLPPFCKLEVERVVQGAPLQVHCRFVGCALGDGLRKKVLRDFEESSESLSSVQDEFAAMERELAEMTSLARALGAPEGEAEAEEQELQLAGEEAAQVPLSRVFLESFCCGS
jgi:hypothetical protein